MVGAIWVIERALSKFTSSQRNWAKEHRDTGYVCKWRQIWIVVFEGKMYPYTRLYKKTTADFCPIPKTQILLEWGFFFSFLYSHLTDDYITVMEQTLSRKLKVTSAPWHQMTFRCSHLMWLQHFPKWPSKMLLEISIKASSIDLYSDPMILSFN